MNPLPLSLERALALVGQKYDITHPCALISVYYKDGIDEPARALHDSGHIIFSTGKTAIHLEKIEVPHILVHDLTGFPEILRGRVKTLHPLVFGGILGDLDEADDIREMQSNRIPLISTVIGNLYPFREEVAKGSTHQQIIEQIDVGGPSLIRAAAKNHKRVNVICDPSDYGPFAVMLHNRIAITLAQRKAWAAKAFGLTRAYDTDIEEWMLTGKIAGLKMKAEA